MAGCRFSFCTQFLYTVCTQSMYTCSIRNYSCLSGRKSFISFRYISRKRLEGRIEEIKKRKGGDSNPRRLLTLHDFQSCTFDHSDTFPVMNKEEFIGNFSPCKYSLCLFLHAECMVFYCSERFVAYGMLHSTSILCCRLRIDAE